MMKESRKEMFFKKNYKDDYFKNLSFIKEISNEQGNIPYIENKGSNKELLKILMKSDGYPAYNATKTVEEIKNILLEVKEYLEKIKPIAGINRKEDKVRMLNSFLQQNNVDFRPLSMIQINASIKMQEYLFEQEYNKALHEFANCIEDDGKALNGTKEISINEYALYINMVSGFYNQLVKDNK